MRVRGLYVIRSAVDRPPRLDEPARRRAADDGSEPAHDGRLATLVVDFSRFDTWYEIDSFWEGRFLERTRKGAFKKTIAQNRDQVKVFFNHGFDLNIGRKVLGVPEVLEEREESPHLEAGLLDTSYNRDLLPGLRAGGYGSSFMFEVLGESWNRKPDQSQHNPEGLPERDVTEVRLFEAGPVTWPANPDATAGVRSGTDWYAEQINASDQDHYDELQRSFAAFRALHGLRIPDQGTTTPDPTPEPDAPTSDESSDRHLAGTATAAARRRRIQLLDIARR